MLNTSILYSSYPNTGSPFDFLFTFSTCHSVLKCCLYSCVVPNTAFSPQVEHFITFSSSFFSFKPIFSNSLAAFFSSSSFFSPSSSFYLNSSNNSNAPDCSDYKSLCSVFVTTFIKTSTVALSSSLHIWLSSLYLLGSMSYTFVSKFPFSSDEMGSVIPNYLSFFVIVYYFAFSNEILTLISPLAILYRF